MAPDKNYDSVNSDKHLKNLKQAEKFSKDINKNFSSWAQNAEKINNYQDALANKMREVERINNLIANESNPEILKQLEAQLKHEEEKVELNKAQIKLLSKQISLWKTLGNSIIGLGGQLFKMYNDMDSAARKTPIHIGMSIQRMDQFRDVAAAATTDLMLMGLEAAAAGEMQGAFADETGRQLMLGKESLETMGQLSVRTGVAHSEMAGMSGQMEAFGLGAQDSLKMITSIADMSDTMGVNTGKVIKKFQQNLGLLNKLNFRGGMKSMAKMAAHSEKFKLSMEGVASVADKVWNPEGAIEAAAHLQTLGGSFAQLGDPFQLMFQARNAPEELAKSLTKAAKSSAVFNKESGEFEVNALELSRLKEAATALGMDFTELVKTAKQGAKISMFEGLLKVGGKEKEFLSSIAEMKDGKAQIQVKPGEWEELRNLSKTQQQHYAKTLKAEDETNKKRAEASQTTMERLENMWNATLAKMMPHMDALEQLLRGPVLEWAKKLKGAIDFFVGHPMIGKLILGFIAFGKISKFLGNVLGPLKWYANGLQLSKGFNVGTQKGGFFKKIKGFFGMGKQSAAGPLTKSGKPDMRFKANKQAGGLGKAGKGAAGTQAMGKSAGGQAKNFLKGAVGLLAIAAALFVFAKALQEFEKLQDGWSTLFLAAGSLIVLGGALAILQPVLNSFGTTAWVGIAAMGALAGSMVLLGVAMQLMEGAGWGAWAMMALSLGLVIGAVAILGSLASTGVGFLGVALMLGIGAAMIMMGAAVFIVAAGMTMLVDSITRLFSGDALTMEKAGAFFILAAGIGALAVSLMLMGASALGAVIAIGILGSLSYIVISTAEALANVDFGGMATEIQNIGIALSSLDTEKMDSLKNAAFWLMAAGLRPVKVEFSTLNINGTIDLKGEGGSAEMDLSSSIFVSELKNMIFDALARDRNGGQLQG